MNEDALDPEIQSKLAQFAAKNQKWIKELKRIGAEVQPGLMLGPKNDAELRKMLAEVEESAAEAKVEEEDDKNHE